MQSPSLEELYLSLTNVSGHLPDTVLRNSSLKALFAIRHSDQRNDTRSAGFTGPIPRSLLASKALQYLVKAVIGKYYFPLATELQATENKLQNLLCLRSEQCSNF